MVYMGIAQQVEEKRQSAATHTRVNYCNQMQMGSGSGTWV